MAGQRPRVFTIPASAPFLPTSIRALAEGRVVPGFSITDDPLALASATIYLPTRRACRLAQDIFLDVLGGTAAMLPKLTPLGDIDEDELVFAQAMHGPLAALLMTYLMTALLTELMGHNPSVVLMVGIAVAVAHSVHADPRPFVVAVAFAAATSFATPVGYPTNTMVYYAGGYRFTDFMKIGIPLIALFCALSMLLIPRFWPLG